MKEIVVISGKGGTGKTTLTACFAALARDNGKVVADADVDAADLFILLAPEIKEAHTFRGSSKARIERDRCTRCAACLEVCRFQAISDGYVIDPIECEGCGLCTRLCPTDAIVMEERVSGEWYISETRYGPFVHARLGIGEENSGKLVTVVRHHARMIAEERGMDLIIVDGPPGVGCPVISSITGAHLVLIVTEPTLSGVHDMKRVAELAAHFKITTAVCINKWDLNKEISQEISTLCNDAHIHLVGKIPYDMSVSRALVRRAIVVECEPQGPASLEIISVWERVRSLAVEPARRGAQ